MEYIIVYVLVALYATINFLIDDIRRAKRGKEPMVEISIIFGLLWPLAFALVIFGYLAGWHREDNA